MKTLCTKDCLIAIIMAVFISKVYRAAEVSAFVVSLIQRFIQVAIILAIRQHLYQRYTVLLKSPRLWCVLFKGLSSRHNLGYYTAFMSNVFEVADITDATVAFNTNFVTSNIYILYISEWLFVRHSRMNSS